MILYERLLGGVAGASARPRGLLLDTYTGAAAAYSLRKLRTAYAGSAIRVRESGGDTEADIGFSGNNLDTAALLSHCGANDGYVVTIYDQNGSGTTFDVTQATSTDQMQIVSAGSLIKDASGNLAMRGVGATNPYVNTGYNTGQWPNGDYYFLSVLQSTQTSTLAITAGAFNAYLEVSQSGSSSTTINSNSGTPSYRKNGSAISPATRGDVYTQYMTGSPVLMGIDAIDFAGAWADLYICGYPTALNPTSDTLISAMIFFDAPSDVGAIDADAMTEWGIA